LELFDVEDQNHVWLCSEMCMQCEVFQYGGFQNWVWSCLYNYF